VICPARHEQCWLVKKGEYRHQVEIVGNISIIRVLSPEKNYQETSRRANVSWIDRRVSIIKANVNPGGAKPFPLNTVECFAVALLCV
jgi:hypothetical protein